MDLFGSLSKGNKLEVMLANGPFHVKILVLFFSFCIVRHDSNYICSMVGKMCSSRQGALDSQRFTKVKYITRLWMGYATGGVLVFMVKFKKLPPKIKKS